MKKIKIKYDFQIFNSQKYGGISKYFYYLFINLKKIGHYPDVIAPFHINEYLNNLNKKEISFNVLFIILFSLLK